MGHDQTDELLLADVRRVAGRLFWQYTFHATKAQLSDIYTNTRRPIAAAAAAAAAVGGSDDMTSCGRKSTAWHL